MPPERRAYRGDARETRRSAPEAQTESRASTKHPGRNEDASIGDTTRIAAELRELPHTDIATNPEKDDDTLRAALTKESTFAPKLRERGVHGVLDGVSGKSNGGGLLASRIASGKIAEIMAHMPKDANAERALISIETAIQLAHRAVAEYKEGRPELEQMSTTVDLVKTVDNGDGTFDVAYGHVGDGRIYVLDGASGALRTETFDDGYAKLWRDKGKENGGLSPDEYDQVMNAPSKDALPDGLMRVAYNYRNQITKAVGYVPEGTKGQELAVTTGMLKLKKGDRLLISTDGIHDNLTSAEIAEVMRAGGSIKELIDKAAKIAASGTGRAKPDDMTGTIIDFGGSEKPSSAKAPEGEREATPEERSTEAREEPATDAQLDEWRREVGQAKLQISQYEGMLRGAESGDAGAIAKVRDVGGKEKAAENLRGWQRYALSRERLLAHDALKKREAETGLNADQIMPEMKRLRASIERQRQIRDAAQSATGETPVDVTAKAEARIAEAQARIATIESHVADLVRAQDIEAKLKALEEETREAAAAAERGGIAEARERLDAATEDVDISVSGDDSPAPPKKRGLLGRLFGKK